MIGRWLAAWGDAFTVGMLVAIFVAFRPHWLATYSTGFTLRPCPTNAAPLRRAEKRGFPGSASAAGLRCATE